MTSGINKDKFKAMGGRLGFIPPFIPPQTLQDYRFQGHYRTSIHYNIYTKLVRSYRDSFFNNNTREGEQIVFEF